MEAVRDAKGSHTNRSMTVRQKLVSKARMEEQDKVSKVGRETTRDTYPNGTEYTLADG